MTGAIHVLVAAACEGTTREAQQSQACEPGRRPRTVRNQNGATQEMERPKEGLLTGCGTEWREPGKP
jgi:hypothetical protein